MEKLLAAACGAVLQDGADTICHGVDTLNTETQQVGKCFETFLRLEIMFIGA